MRPYLCLSSENLYSLRSVCPECGHVEKGVLQNETAFTKGPGGEATAVGQHISDQAGTRGGGRIANGRLISYQVLSKASVHGPATAAVSAVDQLLYTLSRFILSLKLLLQYVLELQTYANSPLCVTLFSGTLTTSP